MASATFSVTSFDGESVSSGNLLSKFLRRDVNNPTSVRNRQPVEATIPGYGQSDVRSQPTAAIWRLYVKLTATDETDIQSMLAIFSEERGLAYLRASDGSGTTWRVAARVIAVEREAQSTNLYVVTLRVPLPVWEEDTATTVQSLNQTNAPSSSPATFTCTNGGTRKCRPEISIVPDVNKTFNLYDYKYVYQGFFVSRMPFPGKVGVYLGDQTAAAARFATDSSATGATVRQTTGATTITVNIAAGATTITLTSSANWPAKGLGYITDTRANGFHDQFYYDGISGNVLQNVVWLRATAAGDEGTVLTGGGIAHTTVQVSSICPSGVRLDAWDLRAWVDDSPVECWPVAWYTSASDVVLAYDLGAQVYVTLREAMTSIAPAVGSSVYFNESVADLPPTGFLALETEIVHYSQKTGTNGVLLDGRGLWGTTAASHVVNTKAYANPHRMIVAAGKAITTAPNRPTSSRPAFQLAGSSNQKLLYGDESNDSNTIFFNPATPNRPMQFVPGFDLDGNDTSPLLSISAYTTALTFKDDVPGDGNPPYNFAELTIPQGIDAGLSTAIVADWTPAVEILNLEMFARDSAGVLKLIDQLQQSAAPANRSPSSFTNNMYGLKLKGRYNVITGWRAEDTLTTTISNATNSPNVNGVVAVQFTFSGERVPTKISARMAKATAGSQTVTCYIFEDSSGFPGTSVVETASAGTQTISGTTPTLYSWVFGPRSLTKAGTYWAVFFKPDALALDVNFYGATAYISTNQRIKSAKMAGGSWDNADLSPAASELWCHISGTYNNEGEALLEPDQPIGIPGSGGALARTATTASFDGVEITLEPTQTVYVHRVSAFQSGATAGTLHHVNGVFTDTTTGDTLAVDKWMKLASTLTINCGTLANDGVPSVSYLEDAITYSCAGCVTPSNRAEFFPFAVGANAVTYYDEALVTGSSGQQDLTITYRKCKV